MLFANVMLGFKEVTVLRHGPSLEHSVRVQFRPKRKNARRRSFPLLKYFSHLLDSAEFPRIHSHMSF